jgi:outer membrane murein-binding lipoprotein Lpp
MLVKGVGHEMLVKGFLFAFLVMAAGCTDLKPLEARIDELQSQVNKLQADIAKSSNNAAAANSATAASVATASRDAKQALSIGEANTAAIDKLNAKIDQMFKKRPD